MIGSFTSDGDLLATSPTHSSAANAEEEDLSKSWNTDSEDSEEEDKMDGMTKLTAKLITINTNARSLCPKVNSLLDCFQDMLSLIHI